MFVCIPPKIEIQKKTLEKQKKIEKIIIAIVSASNILQKKKERWSVSPGMIVVEARTTFFLRETINNDCGQCRIRDNTLNIFTILPLLNKFFTLFAGLFVSNGLEQGLLITDGRNM